MSLIFHRAAYANVSAEIFSSHRTPLTPRHETVTMYHNTTVLCKTLGLVTWVIRFAKRVIVQGELSAEHPFEQNHHLHGYTQTLHHHSLSRTFTRCFIQQSTASMVSRRTDSWIISCPPRQLVINKPNKPAHSGETDDCTHCDSTCFVVLRSQ